MFQRVFESVEVGLRSQRLFFHTLARLRDDDGFCVRISGLGCRPASIESYSRSARDCLGGLLHLPNDAIPLGCLAVSLFDCSSNLTIMEK